MLPNPMHAFYSHTHARHCAIDVLCITVVAHAVFTFTLPVYIYSWLNCKLSLSHTKYSRTNTNFHPLQESVSSDEGDKESTILTGESISMEEFHNAIVHTDNIQSLLSTLQERFDLHHQFLFQILNRAIVSERMDVFVCALEMDGLLPLESPLRLTDQQVMHLLQKAVTVQAEDTEAVAVLLGHIRDPEIGRMKMELQSLAILAAQFGSFVAVRQLCAKYAMCLEQNFQGKSVLLELVRFSDDSANFYLSELLRMGVYVNTQDPDGNTALHLAAERGLKDVAKLLLSHGACINLPNARGKKAIDLWGKWDDPELSKLLCGTPEPHEASLYHAAERQDLQSLERLLSLGVLVDSKWIHGRTALCAAARTGNRDVVNHLLAAGAKLIPLGCYWPELPIAHALASSQSCKIAAQLMIETERSLARATRVEREHVCAQLVSLLHYCAQCGYTSVAESILESCCNINADEEFIEGLAPIHVACKYNQLPMVKLLLAHGCSPNLPSRVYGNTPLHYACFYGHLDIAQHLLDEGSVSIDSINYQYETPLYCVLKLHLNPNTANDYVRESSVVFLITLGAKLTKPGRHSCELPEFDLATGAQRWEFVPVQTQKLMIVLRNEKRGMSLASECRWVIRSSLQTTISEDVVEQLGLPFRLQNYVLFRDWFP